MSNGQPTSGQSSGTSGSQQQQAIKELVSNLGSLLKDLGVQDAQALQAIATGVIGLVAATSLLGGVGAVIGIVAGLVSALSQASSQSTQAVQALQNALQQIEQDLAAQWSGTELTNVQNELNQAITAAQQLNSLKNSPPTTSQDIRSTLAGPQDAMNALAPPDVSRYACPGAGTGGAWSMPLGFHISWDDSDSPDVSLSGLQFGYGKQAPPTLDATQNVFNYTSVLPAYLYASSVFLSIGALIDPQFKQNWSDLVLIPNACLLKSVHDYVVSQGLTQLSPGQLSAQTLSDWLNGMAQLAEVGVTGLSPGKLPTLNPTPPDPSNVIPTAGTALIIGVTLEYGYVEKFSGYNSVGLYTILPSLPPVFSDPPLFPENLGNYRTHFNYDGKFKVRLLRRKKTVYVGTGLLHLAGAINNLNSLTGEPLSFPSPSLADWSFRRDIVGNVDVFQLDGSTHLRDVMKFLHNTPPADIPQSLIPGSFRDVLSL